jgi:hypothetical protein
VSRSNSVTIGTQTPSMKVKPEMFTFEKNSTHSSEDEEEIKQKK